MKTTLTTLMTLGLIALSQNAMAQNPTSVSAQITMTRDYTQSILSKIGSTPVDRFNESSDYAKSGPGLKQVMEQTLTEFRSAMDVMMIGSFTDSINTYNELVNNSQIANAEKGTALSLQMQILKQQAQNISAIYQNEIKRLYKVITPLNFTQFEAGGKNVYIKFEDSEKILFLTNSSSRKDAESDAASWNSTFSGNFNKGYGFQHTDIRNVYTKKFNQFLHQTCSTRICTSGIMQQLSNYFLFVSTYLDRALRITLADGQIIEILAAHDGIGYIPYDTAFQIVTQFSFDQSFTNLPLKN